MQKERKDNQFIKKPIYPGGLAAMRELIRKELKYPKEALASKIEGSVYLRYEIDHKGHVTSAKVLSSLGHGCDEEAQRIVHLFKFQVPKTPRKLKVKFHKTIRIHFKLPKAEPQKSIQQGSQITYSITPTPKTQSTPSPKKKSNSYSYTININ